MTVSQSAADILKSRLSRSTPALFTRMVGAPSSSATLATAASTCASSETSAPTATARPPARGDRLDGPLAGALVEVEHGDGAALGGQPYGGRGADAACCAGDDRDALLGGGHLCLLKPGGTARPASHA